MEKQLYMFSVMYVRELGEARLRGWPPFAADRWNLNLDNASAGITTTARVVATITTTTSAGVHRRRSFFVSSYIAGKE
jgi:hypothetical protein